MKRLKFLLMMLLVITYINAFAAIPMRGVVYDVGLKFGGTTLSVEKFDSLRVDYDMNIIKNILCCNTVRIEGESIERLTAASRMAWRNGLKVLFNPWKMEADPDQVTAYMEKAAKAAEELRKEGMDLVFVAGCEYSLFCKGVFPGDTFDERMKWLIGLGSDTSTAKEKYDSANKKLNHTLKTIAKVIRKNYSGPLTYSSGTWENVDWSLFDIVGVDYYRNGESEEDYLTNIERYRIADKPLVVMEFGCCAYKGAAPRGGGGFTIFNGFDGDGNAIYEGGIMPERDETEQADYVEDVLRLLGKAGVDGACVYVFSYPIYPYSSNGIDMDMISYSLVKSYPRDDPHWKHIPAWTPKEVFYRLGNIYMEMENTCIKGK